MSQLSFNFAAKPARRGAPRAKATKRPAKARKRAGLTVPPAARAYLARIGRKGAAVTNRKRAK